MSTDDNIVHIADLRPKPPDEADMADWKSVATHLVGQNKELMAKLDAQSSKIDRLLRGVEVLTGEMHDFRTGKKESAYARLARHDEDPDLLRAKADVALEYPYSATEIGQQLGISGAQVGLLLGTKGLQWAGNSDYQEMTRWTRTRMRFWHKDIVAKLSALLENREPDDFGIIKKDIRGIFARFKTAKRPGVASD